MDARTTGTGVSPDKERDLTTSLGELARGRLSRREFVARALALGLTTSAVGGLLAACGDEKSGKATTGPSPMDTTLPAELVVYNWEYYMSPKVIKSFEKQYGVKVVEKYFDDPEVLAGELESGASYDVIFPSDLYVTILAKKELLQPLDLKLIPNFETYVTDPFRSPSFDPLTDGTKFTVPYMFGTTGFSARLDVVSSPDSSWNQLWDERFKGEIAMLNTARDAMAAGLFALGYSPNTTDQAELDEATAKMVEQKPLVAKYDSNYPTGSIVKGMALTMCWDGDAVAAMNEIGLSKVRYVLPTEGYVIWADGICIPVTAKSPYAAHLFLNHMCDPKNAGECANYIGYQPAIEAADPLIKSMVQRAMRPTPDVLEAGVYAEDLGEFNDAYEAAWKQVKAAQG